MQAGWVQGPRVGPPGLTRSLALCRIDIKHKPGGSESWSYWRHRADTNRVSGRLGKEEEHESHLCLVSEVSTEDGGLCMCPLRHPGAGRVLKTRVSARMSSATHLWPRARWSWHQGVWSQWSCKIPWRPHLVTPSMLSIVLKASKEIISSLIFEDIH